MKVPNHVGLILDGNRRWARKNKMPEFMGHQKGFEQVKKIINASNDLGIKNLTLYCFSSKNFNRPEKEVKFLFKLLEKGIDDMMKSEIVTGRKARCKVLGRTHLLPEKLQEKIMKLERETINNNGGTINFCIAYDGQEEIVDAVKKIIGKKIPAENIDKETIQENLYTNSPSPDLIIRTGMKDEKRLSGFLLWGSSYAEFMFLETYWPDFTPEVFKKCIGEYTGRERRYGK